MKKTFSSPLMLVSFILLTMLVASCANNSLNTPPMVENPEENQGNQPTELRSVTDQLRSIDPRGTCLLQQRQNNYVRDLRF